MDPLSKLAEKNKKHAEIKKKERLEVLGHIPFALVSLAAYISIVVFFGTDTYDPNEVNLWGMSKQVWFVAIVLSAGVGGIFFVASLAFIVWVQLIARNLKTKVSIFKLFFFSLISLSISFLLLLLGKYLDWLIHHNSLSIAEFMSFGFETTPFPIEIAVNFLILCIAMFLLQIAMFVASFPFKAKRHAREVTANK
ncbi:hypothetical protein [Pseudoalteromonas carrageenovora]|uniref:hypothetical protein n=1 Tax=Pseudoalteromonas carrageenovora TaxID=227 RepID=UPI0026E4538F|nr:hypothetical protein [Pseudoalteromonas carrageenovora]MDO6464315.1 hypothetical protein [Pseudoalteromonas carrageenovora]